MELSTKSLVLFLAIVLTGLSAGFMYAWEVSVIAGTKRISDRSYLEAMQAINRAILNPLFYLAFFGSLICLAISTYLHFREGLSPSFWILTLATAAYLAGTLAVTGLGNVPLNESLNVIDITVLQPEQLKTIRKAYEIKWNQLHRIRTIFAVLSFMMVLLLQFLK